MEDKSYDEPFGMESTYYRYKCKKCKEEMIIEDIVRDSFRQLSCPLCNGTLQ